MPNPVPTLRTENTNTDTLLSRQAASQIIRNRLCKDTGPNLVAHCGEGEKSTSISRYNAQAGAAASQQYPVAAVFLEAGGTIEAGAEYVSGAEGVAMPALGAASGSWICGRNIGAQATVGVVFTGLMYAENSRQVP